MLSPVVLLSLLGLLSSLVSPFAAASDAIFPDCTAKPLQGTPVCDTTLPFATRAAVRQRNKHTTERHTDSIGPAKPCLRTSFLSCPISRLLLSLCAAVLFLSGSFLR